MNVRSADSSDVCVHVSELVIDEPFLDLNLVQRYVTNVCLVLIGCVETKLRFCLVVRR